MRTLRARILPLLLLCMAVASGCDGGDSRGGDQGATADAPEPGSFRWAMRKPEANRRMAEAARVEIDRRQQEESRPLSPAEMRALVAKLGDPALRRCPKDADALGELPIEDILNRLQRQAPPELVPLIADLARHESSKMRWVAALALGNVASDEALPPLRALLADRDAWVRNGAMMGISRGIRAGRGGTTFRKAVFADVLASLTSGQPIPGESIPGLLLDLGREQGRAALLDNHVFRPDHDLIRSVIRAFNDRELSIPLERLRPMMKALRPKWTEFPEEYAYGECLVALARAKPDDAEAVIRAALDAPADTVVDMAGGALLILHDLDGIGRAILERRDAVGFSDLTEPERVYAAVFALDASITSGGFHGFFGSSYGDLTSATLTALQKIGAVETHEVMVEACAIFGPKGPSDSYRRRERQVARLTTAQEKQLGEFDRRYYAQSREQVVHLTEYVLANKKALLQTLAETGK